MTALPWRRSTRCAAHSDCVQVAHLAGRVYLGDSTDPTGTALELSENAWTAFLDAVKAGEYDHSRPADPSQPSVDATERPEGRSGNPQPSQTAVEPILTLIADYGQARHNHQPDTGALYAQIDAAITQLANRNQEQP